MAITEDASAPAVVTGTGLNRVPGSLFNITPWYLGLSTDNVDHDGSSDSIFQPTLNTYTDSNFQLNALGQLVMTAPVVGVTTGGSGATRTEFREEDGGSDAAWAMATTSLRQLTVTAYWDPTSITGTGALKQMIVGQIHGSSGTPPLYVAIDYDHSPPRMRLFINGPGVGDPLTSITTSTLMTYRIKISGGQVSFYACVGDASNLPSTPYFTAAASTFTDRSACYLKFGAYNKTNTGSGVSGAAISTIVFYELIQNGVTYTGIAPNGSPITSAAFSPPTNSLLVALVAGGKGSSGAMDTTISDSGGHIWTRVAQAQGTNTGGRGVAAVYCSYMASAPGSIKVTGAVSNLLGGRYLAVKVLNGASAAQTSSTGATRVGATSPAPDATGGQITLSTTAAGSVVYGISDDWDDNDSFTALSGTTTISSFVDSTDLVTLAGWKSTAATITPGSTTLGGTLGGNSGCNVAAFEVLPFGFGSGGGATLTGSGALLSTLSLGAATTVPLQGQGQIGATANPTLSGAASLAGRGVVSASGGVGSGSVTMIGQGLFTNVSPFVTSFMGLIVMLGQGSLGADLDQVKPGASVLSGQGTIEMNDLPLLIAPGAATLTGQGIVSVDNPMALTVIAATLSGQGALAPFPGVPFDLADASLSGSGLVGATAVRSALGTALLKGQGTLLLTIRRTAQASVHLNGSGTLQDAIQRRTFATIALAGRGALANTSVRAVTPHAALHGAGRIVALTPRAASAVRAALRGTGHLSAQTQQAHLARLLLAGSGRVGLRGLTTYAAVALSGSGTVHATGITGFTGLLFNATTTLVGHGRMWAQRLEIAPASAALHGSGLLAVDADIYLVEPILLTGQGHITASTYTPVFPAPVAPPFPTTPFGVQHEPVRVTFTVIPHP